MSDDAERDAAVKRYHDELVREIERYTAHAKILASAAAFTDAAREQTMEALVQFEYDTLPIADAPPLAVAIMRAEAARVLLHLRRAGKLWKQLGLPMQNIEVAMRHLKLALDSMPDDLPKHNRRLP
jgi:hypothetical protein